MGVGKECGVCVVHAGTAGPERVGNSWTGVRWEPDTTLLLQLSCLACLRVFRSHKRQTSYMAILPRASLLAGLHVVLPGPM